VTISFQNLEEFPGWHNSTNHQTYFESLLTKQAAKYVLEIGSGANPILTPRYVHDKGISYVTSDVDSKELEKADPVFKRIVLDISSGILDPGLTGKFDCILSTMVGEHISYGAQYHKNIFKMLKPGGISAHCFSTLGAMPFVANRILPEPIADFLLQMYAPRDSHKSGKFKAYYSWSRGPSKGMVRRFEGLGFEVINYTGYFGHNYYQSVPFLHRLETMKARRLLKHPIPMLCSYATILLRKPD
jgi:2-polyprenyl-3-methyl-5-hydroxy-6-metoxy-1,4-benzoquinol methylase